MAVPNFAYVFGTTPASGGVAAFQQAITSTFLGVNTTLNQVGGISVTGSQAVTPTSMTNIGVGTAVWISWGNTDQECVSVTAVTGSTFTATFNKTHANGVSITCGLPTLGVANPWTKLATPTLTNIGAIYQSTANTATGDNDYITILYGNTGTTTQVGFGVADDIATSGAGSPAYQNVVNYTGTAISFSNAIQDAAFSWWIVICEFGIWVSTQLGTTLGAMAAGSFRTVQPTTMRGVGTATALITLGATSVTVTPDISSRITPGQKILIVNNSHNSGSTNWQSNGIGNVNELTVSTVSGTGTQATIAFTAGTTKAFDAGALVGAVPQKYCVNQTSSSIDGATQYLSRNLDGSYSGATAQSAQSDTSVITSDMTNYASPMLALNSLYAGELDLAGYQTNAGYHGICGFLYGVSLFAGASTVNTLDVLADPSIPAVWKAFKGTTICGMGPLTNPLNTTVAMTPVSNTPWLP